MNSQSLEWTWFSDAGVHVTPDSYYESFSISEVRHPCVIVMIFACSYVSDVHKTFISRPRPRVFIQHQNM